MTNKQLLHTFNTNKHCPDFSGLVLEMLNRNLLNSYILYAIEQTTTAKTINEFLKMDVADLMQIGLIDLYQKADKFIPGIVTPKTYSIMCFKSKILKVIEEHQTNKRTANCNTIAGEKLDDFLIQSPVNIEKYVISKMEIESYLLQLNKKERTAILMKNAGYKDKEIASKLGYQSREAVSKMIRKAYIKIRKEVV